MLTLPDFINKKVLIIHSQDGDKISFSNDNIIIYNEKGKVKSQISCYKVFALFIIGGFTLTSGLLNKSKNFGFSIMFFTVSFKLYSTVNYSIEGNTILRYKQYTTTNSNEIAQAIIINKINSQKKILQKTRDSNTKDGITILNNELEKLKSTKITNNTIMGLEGIAAKVYFKRLFKDYEWKGRQPRVKRDKINLLLDIGYTVLFNYIEAITNGYGFDIYKGNLHQEFYKRKSLICDLIEPFRPIVDYKIRKIMNLNQIKKYKFKINNGAYQLEWKDSSDFITLILEEIIKYREQIFKFIQQYYRWVMKDGKIADFPMVKLDDNN
jgi:CRISPR-associated protein Cas1